VPQVCGPLRGILGAFIKPALNSAGVTINKVATQKLAVQANKESN
jgi:hypothetical protein